MADVTPGKGEPGVRISAVWIAEQFAEIRTTLMFVRDQIQQQAVKEAAQDGEIEALRRDIAEIKADVRSIKESRGPKVSVFVIMTAITAVAAFGLSLLNQLYGGA
jgi:ribosomal protein L29